MKFRGTIEVRETRKVEVGMPLKGYVVKDKPGPWNTEIIYAFFPCYNDKGTVGATLSRDRATTYAAGIDGSEVVWMEAVEPRVPGEVRVGDVWVWNVNSAKRPIRIKVRSRHESRGWYVTPLDKFPYETEGDHEWFTDECFVDGTLVLEG